MATKTRYEPEDIASGALFDTPYETGCLALSDPDEVGQFLGLDSDDVECMFCVAMVTRIWALDVEDLPDHQAREAGR